LAIAAQIADFLPLAVCETMPYIYTSGVVVTSEVGIWMVWEKSSGGENEPRKLLKSFSGSIFCDETRLRSRKG
jgi:hypothetical protein